MIEAFKAVEEFISNPNYVSLINLNAKAALAEFSKDFIESSYPGFSQSVGSISLKDLYKVKNKADNKISRFFISMLIVDRLADMDDNQLLYNDIRLIMSEGYVPYGTKRIAERFYAASMELGLEVQAALILRLSRKTFQTIT